jgi:protein-L-isoaspartate(D-aspartate) O-methyltransferase
MKPAAADRGCRQAADGREARPMSATSPPGISRRLARARVRYAREVAASAGALSVRLETALKRVPRELFLGPPPWLEVGELGYKAVPGEDPALVYRDVLFALDPVKGINNGEPTLHARMLAALDPQPGDHLAHVGCGTGYYSAILAELVGPQGRIIAFEIEPELAARASSYLARWSNVEVRAESAASTGLPPVDGVYVNAGATRPLPQWLDALKEGGRLVFPLAAVDGWGMVLKLTRSGRSFAVELVCPVRFICCIGAASPGEGEAVARALRSGALARARSLHRDTGPDESCVLAGEGWWLSDRALTHGHPT